MHCSPIKSHRLLLAAALTRTRPSAESDPSLPTLPSLLLPLLVVLHLALPSHLRFTTDSVPILMLLISCVFSAVDADLMLILAVVSLLCCRGVTIGHFAQTWADSSQKRKPTANRRNKGGLQNDMD